MNTKHILRYAAAAVAALAATACSKDDAANSGTPENPDTATPFTITASFDDAPDTRYAATDDGTSKIELAWSTFDRIFVINDESAQNTHQFLISSISADGKTAVFKAPDDYPADAVPAFASHTTNIFTPTLDPKNVPGLLRYYTATASDVSKIVPLYGRYAPDSRNLIFNPLPALLKLLITLPEGAAGEVSPVRISSADGSNIFFNDFSCKYDITTTPFSRASDIMTGDMELTKHYSGSFTLSPERTITLYYPIHPGEELAGKQLLMEVTAGGVKYSATITGGRLESGKCYPLTLPASKWTAAVQ